MGKDNDLIQAVKNNDIGTVRKILAKLTSKSKKSGKKWSINVQDEDGFTSLHLASLNGNTDITMALLDVPECNVNARDKKGMSPLHLASWAGKTEIAKLLVNYRACVNTCADTGDTPLHLACQHHNAGVVEILLDSNVDCTVVNKNGESPLDLACRFGHVQVVELLLKSKDFPKLLTLFEENPKTADPPLHVACKTGREEIVVMLLDAGADVNQRGTNGTALHEAALFGKTEVVKILLDNEADVSITNEEGYTPLDVVNHFTSSRASQEIKELLKDASKSKVLLAKAVHDYRNLYDPTCLSLKVGDTVEILEKNDNGRWKGIVTNGDREIVGYFPSSMVKVLSNPRKTSAKPLSMKDAGVLPIGKYELVTLPTVSEQSPPVQGKRPRMSSFGKPNDKEPHTPPTLPKADHRPTSPPNPITNGIKENRLFQKNQESLQYVQVAVDNGPTSPTSPRSANGSRPTQYAEVLLHDELNDKLRDKSNAAPPPSLPDKKYKSESEVKSENDDDDDDIWIKNSPGQPELPPKTRSKTSSEDSINAAKTIPSPAPDLKPKPQGRQLKDWEKDLVLEDDLAQTKKLAHNNELTTFNKATVKPDQRKSAEHNTETLKPNYEDMTLNTPERHNTKEHSPTKVEQTGENGGHASPGLTRRQLMSYENVELKGRHKDEIQSMLITEVDQEVEAPVTISHNYENIHKRFEKEKNKDVQTDYETMMADDHMSKYETMKRGMSLENIADSSSQDKDDLSQTDSYENVGVGGLKTNSSSDYLHVNDQDDGPSHSYINISIPAVPEGSSPSPSKQPSGLTMTEYNALYDWLESCKLAIYIDHFVKGGFDMISVTGLTPEDLTAMNIIKTGHRKKLLSESAKQNLADSTFPHEKPADIMTWLKLIQLDQYTPQLIDNGFDDLDFVQDITIEDLESIGITKPGHQRKLWLAVSALNTGAPSSPGNPPEERYLETDLDQVHVDNMREVKEKEGRSTDIDSALSRLPADGASDSCVADEDMAVVTSQKNASEPVDSAVASLQIDSLAETRGSTPDLDAILDSLDDDQPSEERVSTQREVKKSPGPLQNISRNKTQGDVNGLESSYSSSTSKNTNSVEPAQSNSEEVPDTKSNKSMVEIPSSPKNSTELSTNQSTLNNNITIQKTSSDLQENKPRVEDTKSKLPSPFQLSLRPKIPAELNSTENLSSNTTSQRTSTEVAELKSQFEKASSSSNSSQESLLTHSSSQRVFQPRSEDTKLNGSTSSSHESLSSNSSPIRARHNSLQEKTGISVTEDRSRGMSFDSKVGSKKPPPPVKPKSFKKPPPKIAPKPKLSQSRSFESEMNKLENQGENDRTERRQNIRSKQPPPVVPKTRHGSVHSTSSEGSIDSVIEELEHQKHFEDRRKSFEKLRRRFTDPESSGDSGVEERSDQNKQKNDSNSEGLENQIKEVFRRSRENVVETDKPEVTTDPSTVDATDDDLERDQQITDDLMKDISSMLSDFSTEIDCMFDTTTDDSTSV